MFSTLRGVAVAAALALVLLAPSLCLACACGCGIFGVGTSSLFPSGAGGQAWIDTDYLDQSDNRSGERAAPLNQNPDKRITTAAVNLGGQYLFNRAWGVTVEVPYWFRAFRTTGGDGRITTFHASSIGDIRLKAIYTGFSPDLSSGVTFGMKLPSGDFSTPGFDRDTAIGTGSTDLLLGAYHTGGLNRDGALSYFVQAQWDRPLAYQGGYRPGQELDAAAGLTYTGLRFGRTELAPLIQLIGSHHDRDAGAASDRKRSGYDRLLISPGAEVSAGDWRLYGDVEVPIYERFNGNQLAAPAMFKLILSKAF